MACGMALVFRYGPTVRLTRASGARTGRMALASLRMLMAISTKVSGGMIRPMGMGSIGIYRAPYTRDTGTMTFNMGRARKLGPMVPFSKVNLI